MLISRWLEGYDGAVGLDATVIVHIAAKITFLSFLSRECFIIELFQVVAHDDLHSQFQINGVELTHSQRG